MNKAGKAIVTVGLLAVFGAAAYFSVYQTGRLPAPGSSGVLTGLAGKLTGAVETQEVSGLIAVDVEPYFQDPRVQKVLHDNGFKLSVQRIGSRDMAARVIPGQTPDFFFPSGIVAANQIGDAAKKANIAATVYSPIYSPMVIASWAPIAQILAANGMATEASPGVWHVDLAKLTQLMLDKKRWKDLKGASAYEVNKSVLVSTTDVRKSNSAAMYLALTSYAFNGGELVTDRDAARKAAMGVAGLFKRQGYQENYVNGNFDDYLSIGIGKTPMAFIYENQVVSYAMSKKGLSPGMVLVYPQPTLFNKVVFVATTDRAKKLGELLSTNTELQRLAVDFGFRIADSSYFVQATKAANLAVEERLTQVIDPPSFDMMAEMIDTITREMAQ
nr:substrate-binding domain-containing protein [Rhodoferax sp.]